MGIEYRLSFQYPNREIAEREFGRLNGVGLISETPLHFEFRHEANSVGMPDASASFEEYGLYFCDHGGYGRDYLGQVVAHLVSKFGLISVAELE